jgi:hypothetical protein
MQRSAHRWQSRQWQLIPASGSTDRIGAAFSSGFVVPTPALAITGEPRWHATNVEAGVTSRRRLTHSEWPRTRSRQTAC